MTLCLVSLLIVPLGGEKGAPSFTGFLPPLTLSARCPRCAAVSGDLEPTAQKLDEDVIGQQGC